jgi:CRP/FNR family transcriptional regulator, dissimilatory nitrate respiration regulator
MPVSGTRRETILPALGRLPLFEGWPPRDLADVAAVATRRALSRGEVLFWEGRTCGHFHILVTGRIHMCRLDEAGHETTLHTIEPGGLVGCVALFLGKAYPASARAAVPSVVFSLAGPEFLRLLETRPAFNRRFIAALASRLGALASSLHRRSRESAVQRVAEWILANTPGNVLALEGRKRTLAGELGMTAETLSRCFAKLSRKGAVRIRGRRIEIISRDALQRVVAEESPRGS